MDLGVSVQLGARSGPCRLAVGGFEVGVGWPVPLDRLDLLILYVHQRRRRSTCDLWLRASLALVVAGDGPSFLALSGLPESLLHHLARSMQALAVVVADELSILSRQARLLWAHL